LAAGSETTAAGWHYRIGLGEVSVLDPANGEFRPVAMADEALRTPF